MSGELVTTGPEMSLSLFQGETPEAVLEQARMIAEALKPALRRGGMVQEIGDSEHVKVEGWQTLGSMLKVQPHIEWCRPLPEPQEGYEARCQIKTLDGHVVSAGQAICSRAERNWAHKPDFQIYSMAQTRATSKAFSSPLKFIVTLAGFSGTPAEEVDGAAEINYGKAAKPRDLDNLKSAALMVYEGDVDATGKLLERLLQDAGGYMPKVVARAVQFVAAYRPTMTEAAAIPAEPVEEPLPEPDPDEPGPDPEGEPPEEGPQPQEEPSP